MIMWFVPPLNRSLFYSHRYQRVLVAMEVKRTTGRMPQKPSKRPTKVPNWDASGAQKTNLPKHHWWIVQRCDPGHGRHRWYWVALLTVVHRHGDKTGSCTVLVATAAHPTRHMSSLLVIDGPSCTQPLDSPASAALVAYIALDHRATDPIVDINLRRSRIVHLQTEVFHVTSLSKSSSKNKSTVSVLAKPCHNFLCCVKSCWKS